MKLTFISDTHLKEPKLKGGDILFHTGDLSINGFRVEIIKSLNYLHEQLDIYKYVVITPGNHDLWIERHPEEFKKVCESAGIIGLINEGINLEGLNIWASPVTKIYHDWAFNKNGIDRERLWERIPEKTDILLTHSPPFGILDKTKKGEEIGCEFLLEKVLEIKPKIHAFGHVHESFGQIKKDNIEFINSADGVIDIIL